MLSGKRIRKCVGGVLMKKTNKELNQKSKDLIRNVRKAFKDEEYYRSMIYNTICHIVKFYTNISKEELENRVCSRLYKGGLEYGEPGYSKKRVVKEQEEEMIDILGWGFTEKGKLETYEKK